MAKYITKTFKVRIKPYAYSSTNIISCNPFSVYTEQNPKIKYTIKPIIDAPKPYLQIKLKFEPKEKELWLNLPDQWASQKDFYKQIRNLKIANATLKNDKSPTVKNLFHREARYK